MNVAAASAPVAGPLRPIELATGAVLGGLTIALSVVASFVPLLASVQLLAVIPMAVIAHRHRRRATITAAGAALAVGFVVGGLPTALGVISCAVVGGIIGDVRRRGRGLGSVLALSTLAGAVSAVLLLVVMWLLAPVRTLVLRVIGNTLGGLERLLRQASVPAHVTSEFHHLVEQALRWWWVWVGGGALLIVIATSVASWYLLGAVLDRLALLPAEDHLDAPTDPRPVAPLPVQLTDVTYEYPGSRVPTLAEVNLRVDIGEFVAVVGHNGSGKSTLTRILAGRPPTDGQVSRPGAAGLGRFGGTAVVLQRPESQLLGVLVSDDVVWGLPAEAARDVDIDGLLAEVGLAGLGDRETLSLSGGQQQRLAVAAALARRPSLLVADEVTAMVDPPGRAELVALLRELPRRRPMSVVLVTHHEADAAAADRVIHLVGGRVAPRPPDWRVAEAVPVVAPARAAGSPLLRLREVHHTYLACTPWATEALRGVDLTVGRGEGVLVVGGNGSGKSTLAWIMAGLIAPTAGVCELDGKPMTARVGRVGLAFQHSRLQLLRRTVGDEIASWGGPSVGTGEVARAMDAVGLDRRMAVLPIDQLSGGQARRVLIAGLLARRPRMLVLDEPLAGLDPAGRRDIVGLLASLRATGLTIVVISHDTEGMGAVCNRTVWLDSGRILPLRPAVQAGATS